MNLDPKSKKKKEAFKKILEMKNQFRSTWRLPVKGLRLTEGSS